MTRVLVSGATGLVGGATAAALGDRGVEVVAFVRDPSRLTARHAALTVAVGDLGDADSLRAALTGVDAVVLVSGHGPDMSDVQQAALSTIAATDVRRVVKISASPVAVSGSASSLGRAHLDVEQTLRASVPEPVVVRPNVFMQNLLAMAPAVAHGVLPGPEGDPTVSFVDARDVGRAAAAAVVAPDPRTLLEVTGPQPLRYSDVADAMSTVLQRPISYAPIPVDVMRQGLQAAGDPDWLAEHKIEMATLMRDPSAARITDHYAAVTGEEPTSIAAFLTAHATRFEAAA